LIRVALRGLGGRKLRATLTALAIILGVAMMSGTYVLTDTIDKAFSQIFDESYAGTDVVVSGAGADISFQGMSTVTPPVDESLVDDVAALPDVEAAAGGIADESSTKIIGSDGKALNTQGAPSFGFGVDANDPAFDRFSAFNLVEGTWAEGDGEVVLDAGTADREGYEVGDTVAISTLQPKQDFEVVGIAKIGDVNSLGTATFAIFDLTTAQGLLDREGQVDTISVAGVEGTTPEQLFSEIQPVLPDDAQVRLATAEAQDDKDEISEFTSFIEYFLLAFAGIALFVGAFVIFNTLSITVAQRTREFATMRTVGASRRQILWSVIVEALTIGILASIIGLFGGLGLAIGLNELFKALDLDLPTTDTVFATLTIVVSHLVGTIITLIAGLFPAIRATRVPPIAAVREGFTLSPGRFHRFTPYIAVLTIGLSLFLLGYSMFRDDLDTATRLLSIAGGVLLLFVGVALISSRTVRPLAVAVNPIGKWLVLALSAVFYPLTLAYWLLRGAAFGETVKGGARWGALIGGILLAILGGAIMAAIGFVVGTLDVYVLSTLGWIFGGAAVVGAVFVLLAVPVMWLARRLKLLQPEWPMEAPNVRTEESAGELAKENSRRNTGRTAATAAALMIGIALVTFVAVLANGMKASNRGAIEDQVIADYVVTAQDGFTPFVAAAGDSVADAPQAELAANVRSELGKVGDASTYVTGIEPDTILETYRFDWKDGDDSVASGLGENGAIVDANFAEDHDIAVGNTIAVLTPSGETLEQEVMGLYEPPPFYPLLGGVSITKERFDSVYERPRNQFTFINVAGGPTAATTTSLEKAVADFPDAKVQTRDAWIDQQDEDFNQFLIMLYVLLALSVIVSLFGMVNTLVLSVYERTRELGMLRAVGMTRRQTRRMVRQESVITALIGAALGLPLGIFLAALVTRALQEFDVRFSVPWDTLILVAVIAVIVGIAAAIAPARRAAKLNVLRALQYE
jgi:ABC-type antimicrobial peptide transport system permease subunit